MGNISSSSLSSLPVSLGAPSMARGGVLNGQIICAQFAECSENSVFAVASISKIIVAIAALICQQNAVIKSLDDDVNEYLKDEQLEIR